MSAKESAKVNSNPKRSGREAQSEGEREAQAKPAAFNGAQHTDVQFDHATQAMPAAQP